MSITSEIEEKFGLRIEELNAEEQVTYNNMVSAVQEAQLDHIKLRDYIITMRNEVERELVNEPEFIRIFIFKFENRKQILLKARLKNYMLLEAFLISPEKAKERLEDMVAGMMPKS